MRAWIRVLDAPGCYERAARAERKSALQGSGLVRTVGPCAQRRVVLMPRAIATGRDVLLNYRRESATRFERPAKQALALATKPRAKREARSILCHTCQWSSSDVQAEQERHTAIAHLEQLFAVRGVASAIIGTGSMFMPLPSAHEHSTNRQSCTGRILFVHKLCLYVL